MTRKDWDARWLLYYNAYWEKFKSPEKAFTAAHRAMEQFGPRPEAEPTLQKPGVISVIKLGLSLKRGVSMFKFTPAVIAAALVAGASAFGAAYNLALTDAVVTTGEWVSIVWATASAVVAALFQAKPAAPAA
jgi:hypothetical protein